MNIIDTLCERYSSDYQRMADALDRTLAELDRLRLENANLRVENRHLRRLLKDSDLRMLRRAQRDALLIGALHYSGGYTSKRECQSLGMGENRWSLARVLLRRAGLLYGNHISQEDAREFEARLLDEVRVIEESGGVGALKRGSYRHKPRQRRAATGALSGATVGAAVGAKPPHQSGSTGGGGAVGQ